MIFVGLLSVVFLKKRLEWFRWTGMAVVVCGVAMVGAADFIETDEEGEEEGGVNKAVIGDIIIVCAQVIKLYVGCQHLGPGLLIMVMLKMKNVGFVKMV